METTSSTKKTSSSIDATTVSIDADSRRLQRLDCREAKQHLLLVPQSIYDMLPTAREEARPTHEILSAAIGVLNRNNKPQVEPTNQGAECIDRRPNCSHRNPKTQQEAPNRQ